MISKLLVFVVLLAFLVTAGGFAVLAAWDVSVVESPVEKMLDNTKYLEKST